MTPRSAATMAEWVDNWALGRNLEKMLLDVEANPSIAPLLAALVQWVKAVEELLSHPSSSSQALNNIWDTPFPKAALVPEKWLVAWREHFEQLAADTTNPGLAGQTSDLVLSLKLAIKLAKASISRFPDFNDIGLAGLDQTLRLRAGIFERVAGMEWAKHAFWAADVSDLSDFDQDMVTRMELHTWGLY